MTIFFNTNVITTKTMLCNLQEYQASYQAKVIQKLVTRIPSIFARAKAPPKVNSQEMLQ